MKGVGEAAVESIIAERNANGRFKDIYDLMERVNFSAVNRKCFENLAYAGGFDSISGFHRGKFFGADARDNTGVTFIEQLMRYGQRFQAEKNNAQQSLFGGGGHVDIQRPVLPACADWSQLETLAKEREMIGLYLSARFFFLTDFFPASPCNYNHALSLRIIRLIISYCSFKC